MLQIAFLVTFCGLLLQMAQATTMPCNQYQVLFSCDTLTKSVTDSVSTNDLMPIPPSSIEDPATGTTYSGVTRQGPTQVNCKITTVAKNQLNVVLKGASTIDGQLSSSQSLTKATCDVATSAMMSVPIMVTPGGDLKCGEMPSPEQVQVSCTSKPSSPGLLGGLLQAILNLLLGVLNVLSNILKDTISSLVPSILKSVEKALNSLLGPLTGMKPVDQTMSCKRIVKNMNTDTPNCIYMTMESNRTSATDGSLLTPPTQTYIAPALTLPTGSACTMAIPEGLMNYVFQYHPTGPYEVTDVAVLLTLSTTVSSSCGKPLTITKLAFKPSGPLQVTITTGRISATQSGSFCVYVAGSTTPLLTATADVMFTGQIAVKDRCITATLTYETMINVRLIPGPNTCDVAYQASLTFTAELKGKLVIEKCVEPSPVADLPITGKPTCTPGDGHVRVTYPN